MKVVKCPECGKTGVQNKDVITPGGNAAYECSTGHMWVTSPGATPLAGVPLDDENVIG